MVATWHFERTLRLCLEEPSDLLELSDSRKVRKGQGGIIITSYTLATSGLVIKETGQAVFLSPFQYLLKEGFRS